MAAHAGTGALGAGGHRWSRSVAGSSTGLTAIEIACRPATRVQVNEGAFRGKVRDAMLPQHMQAVTQAGEWVQRELVAVYQPLLAAHKKVGMGRGGGGAGVGGRGKGVQPACWWMLAAAGTRRRVCSAEPCCHPRCACRRASLPSCAPPSTTTQTTTPFGCASLGTLVRPLPAAMACSAPPWRLRQRPAATPAHRRHALPPLSLPTAAASEAAAMELKHPHDRNGKVRGGQHANNDWQCT